MICGLNQLRWVALLACLLSTVGCSRSLPEVEGKPISDSDAGVVLGSGNKPFVIEVGKVPMGSSHSKQVRLTNGTSSPIRIDGFESTCECTSVAGLPVEVPAGGTQEVTLATDFAKEAGFTGRLAITVELRSGADVRGIVKVNCDVANPVNKKQ